MPKSGSHWFAPAQKDRFAQRVHDLDSCLSEGYNAIEVAEIANAHQRMLGEAGHDVASRADPGGSIGRLSLPVAVE